MKRVHSYAELDLSKTLTEQDVPQTALNIKLFRWIGSALINIWTLMVDSKKALQNIIKKLSFMLCENVVCRFFSGIQERETSLFCSLFEVFQPISNKNAELLSYRFMGTFIFKKNYHHHYTSIPKVVLMFYMKSVFNLTILFEKV